MIIKYIMAKIMDPVFLIIQSYLRKIFMKIKIIQIFQMNVKIHKILHVMNFVEIINL